MYEKAFDWLREKQVEDVPSEHGVSERWVWKD